MEREPITEEEFRDAMHELRRKTRALHEVFPASNKAEQAIERTCQEWTKRLEREPDEAHAKRMQNDLERTAELLREEMRPERKMKRANEMDR